MSWCSLALWLEGINCVLLALILRKLYMLYAPGREIPRPVFIVGTPTKKGE